jgi:hypothetical protein
MTATSVARRGGSGSFAAGGGAVSPGNSRLGQRQTGPEAEAVVIAQRAKRRAHGVEDSGITAKGLRTSPAGLKAAGLVLKRSAPETSNEKTLGRTSKCIYFLLKI